MKLPIFYLERPQFKLHVNRPGTRFISKLASQSYIGYATCHCSAPQKVQRGRKASGGSGKPVMSTTLRLRYTPSHGDGQGEVQAGTAKPHGIATRAALLSDSGPWRVNLAAPVEVPFHQGHLYRGMAEQVNAK